MMLDSKDLLRHIDGYLFGTFKLTCLHAISKNPYIKEAESNLNLQGSENIRKTGGSQFKKRTCYQSHETLLFSRCDKISSHKEDIWKQKNNIYRN